ncbi:ComF family protein [Candidatus Saccharibacteria bacterium]|nr:ComF family protein [Candidatus Saccharibacteria bacterium]
MNICPNCKAKNPTGNCPNCQDLPPTYVVDQRSELIGNLIHDFKYHSVRALASPLAEVLDQTLPAFDGKVAIVPLPTTSSHIRARGFDHTLLLARKLSRLRNYQTIKLLSRVKNTVQVGSDRSTRLSQASSAYEINPRLKIDGATTYLLLDDVWTTGASIRAAIQKLKDAGIKKIAVAILAVSV